MKLEKNGSVVELVKENNILKKIEIAGRCCYNSQNLITEDSYISFIKKIVESGHTSVFEHGNIILRYYDSFDQDDIAFVYEWLLARKAVTESHVLITVENEIEPNKFYIMMSGNARAWLDFLDSSEKPEHLFDADEHVKNIYNFVHEIYPEIFSNEPFLTYATYPIKLLTEDEAREINIAHTYYTFRIETSRDISHQLVRHRTLSFSQQSQRFVNYNLDKNGGGDISFIQPRVNSEDLPEIYSFCESAENNYLYLINKKYRPEVARSVLPNCTKTVIYISGRYNDWRNFIELRTGKTAQEEIREIAMIIDKEIRKINCV
jgi:thymidylate synthase (FAD)